MIRDEIIDLIKSWDGRTISSLEKLHHRISHSNNYIDSLLNLILIDETFQSAISWLLKKYLEDNNKFSSSEYNHFVNVYPKLTTWPAILHFVQLIPLLSINKSDFKEIYNYLLIKVQNENKFIRAWAYNAIYHISRDFAYKEQETIALLIDAQKSEAASVKARIRHILN